MFCLSTADNFSRSQPIIFMLLCWSEWRLFTQQLHFLSSRFTSFYSKEKNMQEQNKNIGSRKQDINIDTISKSSLEHVNYNVNSKLVLEGCSISKTDAIWIEVSISSC